MLDGQAYSKHYFQGPGVHKINSDSPFVILIARIGVKDRYSEADLEKARKAQDNFTIAGQGNKPFTPIQYDNMKTNEDDSYTVSFNCGDSAINNITSTGREFNYIVRAYAASEIVRSGEWNPVSPMVAN